jgi:hypothetical protein
VLKVGLKAGRRRQEFAPDVGDTRTIVPRKVARKIQVKTIPAVDHSPVRLRKANQQRNSPD